MALSLEQPAEKKGLQRVLDEERVDRHHEAPQHREAINQSSEVSDPVQGIVDLPRVHRLRVTALNEHLKNNVGAV